MGGCVTDDTPDTYHFSVLQVRNGAQDAAVLIIPGKQGQQILQGVQTKLFQLLGALRP